MTPEEIQKKLDEKYNKWMGDNCPDCCKGEKMFCLECKGKAKQEGIDAAIKFLKRHMKEDFSDLQGYDFDGKEYEKWWERTAVLIKAYDNANYRKEEK